MTDRSSQRGLRARRRRHDQWMRSTGARDARRGTREAVRQAAVADRLVLTKTDLAGAVTVAATRRAACCASNPGARHARPSCAARSAPAALFDCGPYDAAAQASRTCGAWLAVEAVAAAAGAHAHHRRHEEDVTTFCVVREEPVHAVTLALALAGAIAQNCGARPAGA